MAFLPGSTTLQRYVVLKKTVMYPLLISSTWFLYRTRSSTYAADETEAAQDQGQDQYEELEMKFSDQPDFLDSKLMGSDGGDSIRGEENENGTNNDLVDNDLSDSLHTYVRHYFPLVQPNKNITSFSTGRK